ncbi:hypothetical protein M758_10G052600 [Ceratodon purpureus]|nr:hypothetical protein M758_10G052600 [Ceratodon purpureus]
MLLVFVFWVLFSFEEQNYFAEAMFMLDLQDCDMEWVLTTFPYREECSATFCLLYMCEQCACEGAVSCM